MAGLIVIDEVQRAPELFPVLRVLIDRAMQPGQFLLLGSASPNLLRQTSESLLGRIEVIEVTGFDLDEVGFDRKNAKFVLATGCGNPGREGFGLQIAEAQLAVDGDKGKYPEFKGNVKAVDTRDLWREADVSPVNQGYHYNHNAETYMETGLRLGRAMTEMLVNKK